ncbi:MAG: hypothetical protein WBO45_12365, partial [Planctomycetota bacterium]
AVLRAAIAASGDANERQALGCDLLSIARERAFAVMRAGDVQGALGVLDGVRAAMTARTVLVAWHLARVEVCKDGNDLLAHEREQNRLYDYLEGKE